MGIVNVTPDSFSDGGQYFGWQAAIDHAERLADEGADILDVGGESTRPGSMPPGEEEELRRVIPVVAELASRGYRVSVDTRRARVMAEAIAAGAKIINDVAALRAPGALETVAQRDVLLILMHMHGEPQTMQDNPQYPLGVVKEVRFFLQKRLEACLAAGIARERIALDPGIGFGKTPEHNAELSRNLARLAELGCPLVLGWSRKRSLDVYSGRTKTPQERLPESLAAALAGTLAGASVLRVHDVAATVAALKVWRALAPRDTAQPG